MICKKGVPLHLSQYISKLKIDVKYSSATIQALTSDLCGIYCIVRLLSIFIGEKQNNSVEYFNLIVLEKK